jgi:hypothetical protein
VKVRLLKETRAGELEHRRQVDTLLRGYKDEVDTLTEALRIAATDIAASVAVGEEDNATCSSKDAVFSASHLDEDRDEFYEQASNKGEARDEGRT